MVWWYSRSFLQQFSHCLTSIVSPRSPTRLRVPWGEGKCCLHLWSRFDIHRMFVRGPGILSAVLLSPISVAWFLSAILSFPWCSSLCAHPDLYSSSPGRNLLKLPLQLLQHGVHQALEAQWLNHIVLFKNLKNVDLKRKITGFETQRGTELKLSVRQTRLKPTTLSSPLNVKFSSDYYTS